MIIGIGCDIIDIRRIEKLVKKYPDKFLSRIFTKEEIGLAGALNNYSYFAKRFAAKEAYAKAVGTGINRDINFRSMEIFNDEKKAPFFNRHPLLKQGINAFLSMSDEYPYAISYVTLVKK
jgi:holo-[acyl-carrier protein] synthase